jgi:type II secretory pathway pseudopilin PulG
MLNRNRISATTDDGFSLAEVVVSTAIVIAVLTGFLLFISGIAGTQRSATLAKIADRALAQEIEKTYAIGWDNLMPSSGGATCTLGTGRVSSQALIPSSTLVENGQTITVTRTVAWDTSGVAVACTAADRDRADLKRVSVTVTWTDSGTARSRTVEVLRSRWIEGSSNPVLTQ